MANYLLGFVVSIIKVVMREMNIAEAKYWSGKDNNNLCRLLSQKRICTSKKWGGVGIANLLNMNAALLAKTSMENY